MYINIYIIYVCVCVCVCVCVYICVVFGGVGVSGDVGVSCLAALAVNKVSVSCNSQSSSAPMQICFF